MKIPNLNDYVVVPYKIQNQKSASFRKSISTPRSNRSPKDQEIHDKCDFLTTN